MKIPPNIWLNSINRNSFETSYDDPMMKGHNNGIQKYISLFNPHFLISIRVRQILRHLQYSKKLQVLTVAFMFQVCSLNVNAQNILNDISNHVIGNQVLAQLIRYECNYFEILVSYSIANSKVEELNSRYILSKKSKIIL